MKGGGAGTVQELGPSFGQLLFVARTGRPRFDLITIAVIVSLLEIAAILSFPLIAKSLVDGLPGLATASALLGDTRAQLLLAVLLIGAAAGGASGYLLARAGLEMIATLKLKLVERLLEQPVPYFDERESGELASRITKDSDVIASLVTTDLQHLVSGLLLLTGSAIVLALLDLPLAVTILAAILAAFALMAPALIGMSRITMNINDRTAALTATLARTFREIRLVKAFGAERHEQARGGAEIGALLGHNLRAARIQASLHPMVSLALSFAMLAIFAYGGARVGSGTLSIGTLTAFILYVFNIVAPLIQLSVFFTHLNAARGAALRIAQILSAPGETIPARAAAPRRTAAALIERRDGFDLAFEGVKLAYAGAPGAVLSIDSLTLPAAASIAIIGPSGVGKSSIFSLIERFYEPTEGRILWGGVDIRALPLDKWRGLLGSVPQCAPLMAGTIRENIVYGSPFAVDDAMVEAAARAAHCHDFVMAMPGRFSSQVGEGGNLLSGGQRQRIALARMFIRDPRILLMDEATANLDEESEALVLGAMRHLMRGRMTLVITHRLALAADADFIAVLEDGRLEAFGPAAEIMATNPYYMRLRMNEAMAPAIG